MKVKLKILEHVSLSFFHALSAGLNFVHSMLSFYLGCNLVAVPYVHMYLSPNMATVYHFPNDHCLHM